MRHRSRFALLAAAGLAAVPAIHAEDATRGTAFSQGEADKAIYEEVCGSCHPASMVTDLRSPPEWTETVERMEYLGAAVSEQQRQGLMRYLMRYLTKVNVNVESVEALQPVLDITDAAARALVEYRTARGKFKSLSDLQKVPGLDAAKLEARKERIVF